MKQAQLDHSDDQDIRELRSEIVRLERKRQIRRKKRRKKRMLKKAVSVIFGLVIIAAAVIIAVSFLSGYIADRKAALREKELAKPFDFLYYYEGERLSRYIAYQEANPGMSAEDVVWRVNTNLDMTWYEYDIPVTGYDDPYIIVNKFNRVPDDYRPPDLTTVDGYQMRKETGRAFLELKNAAAEEGLKLRAVSGYRSVEYQQELYEDYLADDSPENVERYCARAGYSEHHTGMAIDLYGSTAGMWEFKNTPEYPWVKENCCKYGFIIRYTAETENITGYQDEPWHIRYVGKEVSTDMKEKGITSFEEYYAKYIAHSPDEKMNKK